VGGKVEPKCGQGRTGQAYLVVLIAGVVGWTKKRGGDCAETGGRRQAKKAGSWGWRCGGRRYEGGRGHRI
jgi:hypothetical protein